MTATVAEEEYLQSLFWLQEAGLPMTGANVARAMQGVLQEPHAIFVLREPVSRAISSMISDGWL